MPERYFCRIEADAYNQGSEHTKHTFVSGSNQIVLVRIGAGLWRCRCVPAGLENIKDVDGHLSGRNTMPYVICSGAREHGKCPLNYPAS